MVTYFAYGLVDCPRVMGGRNLEVVKPLILLVSFFTEKATFSIPKRDNFEIIGIFYYDSEF